MLSTCSKSVQTFKLIRNQKEKRTNNKSSQKSYIYSVSESVGLPSLSISNTLMASSGLSERNSTINQVRKVTFTVYQNPLVYLPSLSQTR